MELAVINYNGSGKYEEAASAVVPLRTLDGIFRFDEPFPDRGAWWPVVQIWIPGLWWGHAELETLVR